MRQSSLDDTARVALSILYHQPHPPVNRTMTEDLRASLVAAGLKVARGAVVGTSGYRIETGNAAILVRGARRALHPVITGRARRGPSSPAADAVAFGRLASHRSHLTVVVEPLAGARRQLNRQQCAALANHVARLVLKLAPADAMIWHRGGIVLSVEEFLQGPGITRARLRSKAVDALPAIIDELPDHAPGMFERLERRLPGSAANDLPHLPRAGTERFERLRNMFDAVVPTIRQDEGPPAYAEGTFASRLSVYVMNSTILLISFPAGMGLLTYNLLRGEDVRVNARMLALTGTAMGVLGFTELGSLLPLLAA